jgi:hypothetical protein
VSVYWHLVLTEQFVCVNVLSPRALSLLQSTIFLDIFPHYRSLRKVLHISSAISQALDDIPSSSDISDLDSDSRDDKSYKSKVAEYYSSRDDG